MPAGRVPGELEADDVRNEHRDRLSEHGGFGFDAADAPAEHAQAVDHRRVRVGADQRVRIRPAHAVLLGVEHDAREMLDVDLVHDAGVRRHDLEVAERGLTPAQERVAFGVAAELDRGVLRQRVRRAVRVDLHRVIDHELGGRQRIDLVGIAAELDHRFAHRGEVDDGGHAGEVLHDHAAGRERDLVGGRRLRIPVEQRIDVGARDIHAVFEAQQVLEQDLQRIGQAGDVAVFQRSETEDFEVVAAASERRARLERVFHASSGRKNGPGRWPRTGGPGYKARGL